MQEAFKIWIDRLGEGRLQAIEGSFDPSFLEVDEKELQFRFPVHVKGKAYVADQHLVIHLAANTVATMPCAICNEMVETELKVEHFYHSEPINEIPNAVFNFGAPLREALLIELPKYFECCQGNCPERATLAPYLRSYKKEEQQEEGFNFPFSDLK